MTTAHMNNTTAPETPEQYFHKLDSRLTIEVVSSALALEEPAALAAALTRVQRMARSGNLESARIVADRRELSGSLHWIIQFTFTTGGALTVGQLQRVPGGDYEYHS